MRARLPGFRRLLLPALLLGACALAAATALGATGLGWAGASSIGDGPGLSEPQIAVDDAGNATAVWIAPEGVVANTRPIRGTWSSEPVTLQTGGNLPSRDVLVAAAAGGEVVAVWSANVNGAWGLWTASRTPATAWTTPQPIPTEGRLPRPLRLRAGPKQGFALLVDAGGLRTLVKPPRGAWGTEVPLRGASTPADVALDANGQLVAAWTGGQGMSDARRVAGSGRFVAQESPVDACAGAVRGVRLVNEPNGDVTVLWISEQRGGCDAAAPASLSAQTLSASGGPVGTVRPLAHPVVADSLDAAAGPDGTIVAVWRWDPPAAGADPGIGGLVRRGGSWDNAAQNLPGSAGADVFSAPRTTVTRDGTAVALWSRTDASGAAPHAAQRRPGTAAWAATGPLATPRADHSTGVGGLDADGRGNAVAGWLDHDLTAASDAGTAFAGAFDGEPPASPVVAVTPVGTATVGESVAFHATADDSWAAQTDIGFAWSFGDGTSATGSDVRHAFTAPGTYTVTVTASDRGGSSPVATTTVTVKAATVGAGAAQAPDQDHDTIVDASDNCPTVPNTDQADADGDGLGDVCDTANTPVALKSIAVKALRGVVLYQPPANGRSPAGFRRLRGAATLPLGTTLETTRGRVQLTAAAVTRGRATMTGQFFGGRFVVGQLRQAARGPRARRLTTRLRLAGGKFRSTCSTSTAGATRSLAAKPRRKKRKRVRSLWGDGRGSFQTRGQGAAATVRGTRWLTEDRCDGTWVRVSRGRVDVRDLYRHRTVRLRRGQTYAAVRP